MSTISIENAKNLTISTNQHSSLNALNSEDCNYSSFEITNGYGQISSAGATVQEGVTGHISVSLKIRSYSESSYQATTQAIKNSATGIDTSTLEKHLHEKNYSGWWYTLFGIGTNKDSSEYSETTHTNVNITETEIKNALEKNMSSNMQEFSVNGEFDITGTSRIPITVNLFIKTLTITTSNGNSTVVLSNETAAADQNGKVTPSSGKINIGPSLV